MRTMLFAHIAAGGLGLAFGYIALFAAKGGTLHRASGRLFVYAMLIMALGGAAIAAVRGVAPAINVPAGLLTAYLVITALTTVLPPNRASRAIHLGALALAMGTAAVTLRFGFEAIEAGGARDGMPAFPFFMFGLVALLAGGGDLRIIRSGPLRGRRRLARHLWRMCWALFIAAMSFFIGQAAVIPEPIRIMPLLAVPVLVVLVTMLYWLWRVRSRRILPATVHDVHQDAHAHDSGVLVTPGAAPYSARQRPRGAPAGSSR